MGGLRPCLNPSQENEVKKILIAAALLTLAGAASAQSKSAANNFYGELGYQSAKLNLDGAGYTPTIGLGTAILGYQFHPNLSAEVFLATTLSSDSLLGVIETKVDHGYGVNLRPSYKFTDKLEGFVRLGYGSYKTTFTVLDTSASLTTSSVLYGVGANYYFTDKAYGQLSYTSFFDKDGVSLRGFGASVGYKF
jgi:hypothetical protein